MAVEQCASQLVHLLAMYEWKAVNKEQEGEPVSFMRLDAVTRDSMVFKVRKHNSDGEFVMIDRPTFAQSRRAMRDGSRRSSPAG